MGVLTSMKLLNTSDTATVCTCTYSPLPVVSNKNDLVVFMAVFNTIDTYGSVLALTARKTSA